MKAVACRDHTLAVIDLPAPRPTEGQLLLDVRRCGICGSDLHARTDSEVLADVLAEIGYQDFQRAADTVVFGHEFVGEIAEHGPGTRGRLPVGTPVVALPLVRNSAGLHAIGLSAKAPGAYAEQVIVQEALTLKVPNGLSPDLAALTEPMAVGWHAVARGEVRKKDTALVIGCGPVGLAVIAILAGRGVQRIVAADLSPGRRALAKACGAHVVVDPREVSPYDGGQELGQFTTMQAPIAAALEAIEGLSKLPVGWWHAWRALDKIGATTPKAPVIFECVGVPGMLEQVLTGAPLYSRVVVVGVCMGTDLIRPSMAINKELDLRFVVGYTPLEFRDTLHALSEGKIDASSLLTGTVGLEGVGSAFETLADPDTHAKILIDPTTPGAEVRPT